MTRFELGLRVRKKKKETETRLSILILIDFLIDYDSRHFPGKAIPALTLKRTLVFLYRPTLLAGSGESARYTRDCESTVS